ncbi:MAG: hypothetical protein H6Q67_366 [Firmicutes bacterium]|nr:hypothetical protein [Bacillota bacterium]
MQNIPTDEQLVEMTRIVTQARTENWLDHIFGSGHWWALLAFTIIPWLLWTKVAARKQIHELMLFGLFVILSSLTLDELGFELTLWSYPFSLIPVFPRLASADYTMLPVIYMLIYQYFPTWKSFFWASVMIAFIFAIIAEPILVRLGFYVLIKWTYWASFLVYIPLGLLARWITRLLMDSSQKANIK